MGDDLFAAIQRSHKGVKTGGHSTEIGGGHSAHSMRYTGAPPISAAERKNLARQYAKALER